MAGKKTAKKKIRKSVPHGRCYVQAGFGNTIVTLTDLGGEVVAWSSAGHLGFKGSRKGTPFAAQVAAEDAAKKAMETGMRSVDLFLNGPGQVESRRSGRCLWRGCAFQPCVIRHPCPITAAAP